MDNTTATSLDDRTLWFDGDSTIPANDVIKYIQAGIPLSSLFLEEITPEIKQFNSMLPPEDRMTLKTNINEPNFNWVLPDEYQEIDPFTHCVDIIQDMMTQYDDAEGNARGQRAVTELVLFRNLDLLPLLTVLIYIINTLQNHSVVWGTVRGSSVSSYLLYLLGTHDVDSFAYELQISDFIRHT